MPTWAIVGGAAWQAWGCPNWTNSGRNPKIPLASRLFCLTSEWNVWAEVIQDPRLCAGIFDSVGSSETRTTRVFPG